MDSSDLTVLPFWHEPLRYKPLFAMTTFLCFFGYFLGPHFGTTKVVNFPTFLVSGMARHPLVSGTLGPDNSESG